MWCIDIFFFLNLSSYKPVGQGHLKCARLTQDLLTLSNRVTCWCSSGLLGESLCLQASCLLRTLLALLPAYLTALCVHLSATTDSKWRVVNGGEVDSLYASDGELLHHQAKGGHRLGNFLLLWGGLWGDTHKVGFCFWSIFECVLFWLSVCSIAYVTIFNVYGHYTQSFTAVEGAPCLV